MGKEREGRRKGGREEKVSKQEKNESHSSQGEHRVSKKIRKGLFLTIFMVHYQPRKLIEGFFPTKLRVLEETADNKIPALPLLHHFRPRAKNLHVREPFYDQVRKRTSEIHRLRDSLCTCLKQFF